MTTLQDTTIRKLNAQEKIPYDLLLLADPSVVAINAYLSSGELYIMEQDHQVIGLYVWVKDGDTLEIKNIVVHPSFQGKGFGKMLLQDATHRGRISGYHRLCIGTGNSSIAQLYLYQRQGFEMATIIKDYFTTNYQEPIYENGIQCRHMIMLEKRLS
ncbi:GNAT family N-acetyltransferase [Chitinophaga polysaccharea]|uniref:GNAT family N-acetyltransferase n=1 Tax=Chitinophaga TaxID=79328 RepID=UPI0014558F08|nr:MULTISPECIES: GNAT family N-acetyltransferase [Chitinophaga]NLR59117.1 GNAT family N-acetyltransferase [Chitinophaga polysaccharea]NLU92112.1 GNAT family N-acetyltransferase [Chitinophaga sp. Ak27]